MINQQENKDQKKVAKWDIFELTLEGTEEGNPFTDVALNGIFKYKNRKICVDGFYDGKGKYKIRFMPDKEGKWEYISSSNLKELDGLKGSFECVEARERNRGPVRVRDKYHFAYEDGTPYLPFGTTCYVWNHQGDELAEQTLSTLASSPFNKMRMCVFPKHYAFNQNEPGLYPFEGSLEDGWDYTKFNPAYFYCLEKRIKGLMDLGIEADLILFHPYDHWGFSNMDKEIDDRYLKYIVARLAAYKNVWWSFANEFDLMGSKSMADWDRFFKIVQECDPYQHLRSIHNCISFYDHNKPWVTHCSIQHVDVTRITEWKEIHGKPIVVDECQYEGNIPFDWGNITAKEMSNRFWEGFARGGYVGHGETYIHDKDILWWSKGGKLYGESPKRIAFLRDIAEKSIKTGSEIIYFGALQPAYKDINLSKSNEHKIEIIDTWNMDIVPIEGTFKGDIKVDLPGKPYIALRITELN